MAKRLVAGKTSQPAPVRKFDDGSYVVHAPRTSGVQRSAGVSRALTDLKDAVGKIRRDAEASRETK